jgi:transcriptional regulator GlxA family with amidase domain
MMFGEMKDAPRQTIGFVLVPEFALMSAAAAIEPLRAANLVGGIDLFHMVFLSPVGGYVQSSCGAGFETVAFVSAPDQLDMVFVIAGANPFLVNPASHANFLRRYASRGSILGGVSGGAVILARLGLLEACRFTVHWEHIDALLEENPDLLIEKRLFVIDRKRATCAGGVAPLDMMHALIRTHFGQPLADSVSDWFIHTRVRTAEEAQLLINQEHVDLHPQIVAAVRLMQDHIPDPLPVERIAILAGLSQRQMLRGFRDSFGQTVSRFYTDLRLQKANELLRQTRLPVSQVAIATGFTSQSSFARAFQDKYGARPKDWRKWIER